MSTVCIKNATALMEYQKRMKKKPQLFKLSFPLLVRKKKCL